MEQEINDLTKKINRLSYESKARIYKNTFSFGYLNSPDLTDTLVLLSLVTLTYQKLLPKNPSLTPLELLMKITQHQDNDSSFYQYLENLSLIVADLAYDTKKIDPCGLNTSKEIIDKIKELLNMWVPF